MLIYFSATGNCKYVATRIAEALADRCASIEGLDPHIELGRGEALGIVTPTYAWELPVVVVDFLCSLQVTAPERPYVFLVSTFGTTPGQTYPIASEIVCGSMGTPLDAGFCVRMPDTWTPTFDLSDKERVARINEEAEPQIDEVIEKVGEHACGDFMQRTTPRLARPIAHLVYERMRKTSHLHVEDTCIGCGLCARRCPVQAIEMIDRRPVWVKERCAMCLRCLHLCPKFAIHYDRRTKDHGQYRNPHVRV